MPAIIRRSVAVSILIALMMGAIAMPAFGDGRQVLADYEDNGQIDGCYSLAEFEDALKTIRPDQQQYGAAVDVIRQAEFTNIRRAGQPCGAASAGGASEDVIPDDGGLPPVVIAILVAAGLAIIGAVAYWVVSRRRGGGEPPAGA